MKKLKNMKPHFEAYLKAKNMDDSAQVRSLKAHSIPYGPGSAVASSAPMGEGLVIFT
jgi:hypothetical protein